MDAIHSLAKNIVAVTYEDLSLKAIEATKKLILDTLAVSIAGSAKEGVGELVDIFRQWGGKVESTIWVHGCKLPCIHAAQANATMAHALDYDDSRDGAFLHVGAIAVPTALAFAERKGGVDGKSLISAIAAGADLAARLCLANNTSMFDLGWHYTTLHGNFNAASVAGKLAGLDAEMLVNAFGLVYHQAGGTIQCLHDGALAKRARPGFSARNGIMAVLMAQKGITGAHNILQGWSGLYNVYHRGDYDPEVVTANLGEQFDI